MTCWLAGRLSWRRARSSSGGRKQWRGGPISRLSGRDGRLHLHCCRNAEARFTPPQASTDATTPLSLPPGSSPPSSEPGLALTTKAYTSTIAHGLLPVGAGVLGVQQPVAGPHCALVTAAEPLPPTRRPCRSPCKVRGGTCNRNADCW